MGKLFWMGSKHMSLDKHTNATVIYSYGTPIAFIGKSGKVYLDTEKYSVTTSRHQGLVRMNFQNVHSIPHRSFVKILRNRIPDIQMGRGEEMYYR